MPVKRHGLVQLSPSWHRQGEQQSASPFPEPLPGQGLGLQALRAVLPDPVSTLLQSELVLSPPKPSPFLLIECKPFGTRVSLISLPTRLRLLRQRNGASTMLAVICVGMKARYQETSNEMEHHIFPHLFQFQYQWGLFNIHWISTTKWYKWWTWGGKNPATNTCKKSRLHQNTPASLKQRLPAHQGI